MNEEPAGVMSSRCVFSERVSGATGPHGRASCPPVPVWCESNGALALSQMEGNDTRWGNAAGREPQIRLVTDL